MFLEKKTTDNANNLNTSH